MKTSEILFAAVLCLGACTEKLPKIEAPRKGNGRVELESSCGDQIMWDANVSSTVDAHGRRSYAWETGPLGGPPARVTLVDPRAITCTPKLEKTPHGVVKVCWVDFATLGAPAAHVVSLTIENLRSGTSQTSAPVYDAVVASGRLGHLDVDLGGGVRGHDFPVAELPTMSAKDHDKRCTWRGDLIFSEALSPAAPQPSQPPR